MCLWIFRSSESEARHLRGPCMAAKGAAERCARSCLSCPAPCKSAWIARHTERPWKHTAAWPCRQLGEAAIVCGHTLTWDAPNLELPVMVKWLSTHIFLGAISFRLEDWSRSVSRVPGPCLKGAGTSSLKHSEGLGLHCHSWSHSHWIGLLGKIYRKPWFNSHQIVRVFL
jgi:hypothetical protein